MKHRVAVLTVSDRGSRGEAEDTSGSFLQEEIGAWGWQVVSYEVVPDEREIISDRLHRLAFSGQVDLVLTTGGTGLGPRDVTPEATLAVVDRLVPGLVEAMRAESSRLTPHGMLSRGVAGVCCRSLIINLPGSLKAVRECLAVIKPALAHALETLRGGGADHRPRELE